MSKNSRRRNHSAPRVGFAPEPVGGKGASARCSQVFYLPPNCADLKLDGTRPSGTAKWFSEQVTKIDIREEVYSREYGHDKSHCCQDSTTGILSWNGSLSTMLQCIHPSISFHAGQLIWIEVYPLGTGSAGTCRIRGLALIKTASMSMNLENGDPVGRNYDFKSKGKWEIPEGVAGTFDCCNCCHIGGGGGGGGGGGSGGGSGGGGDGSGGGGGGGGGSMAVVEAEVAHSPVTAYQWNGTAWAVVYDECKGEFVQGPAPTAPGTYAGELKFVEGIIGT